MSSKHEETPAKKPQAPTERRGTGKVDIKGIPDKPKIPPSPAAGKTT